MNLLKKIVLLVLFFLVGSILYDQLYLWTLQIITYFSNDQIRFFGKLWDFYGKGDFGFLTLIIPSIYFLISGKVGIRGIWARITYWLVYLLMFLLSFFGVCYLYMLFLRRRIEMDQILFEKGGMHLTNVNLYFIFTVSAFIGGALTYIIIKLLNKTGAFLPGLRTT